MKFKRIKHLVVFVLMAVFLCKLPVSAEQVLTVKTECTEANTVTINIDVADSATVDGVEIYRAEEKDGEYKLIQTLTSQNDDYYYDYYDYYYDNEPDFSFQDKNGLLAYKTYYYTIRPYQLVKTETAIEVTEEKIYFDDTFVEVFIRGAAPKITYGKRSGKLDSKLKWSKVADADGYLIYYIKNYDDKNNYIYNDKYDYSKYTLLKTITNPNTLTTTFKKLKNGITYTYVIYAYKNVDGVQVTSVPSDIKSVTMDYYGYETESQSKKIKRVYGSAKNKEKNFTTASKASKQMKRITIKVWDFKKGKKGTKITKNKVLYVNKKLAPTVQEMFKEIYQDKEKQPIKVIDCYSYRWGEHMYGTAIDINPNENYMIDGKKVMAGSYWKPKKDPYSIPQNSQFVKIMRRYGFYRGEWGDRKDYMHFSFFGT